MEKDGLLKSEFEEVILRLTVGAGHARIHRQPVIVNKGRGGKAAEKPQEHASAPTQDF